MTDIGFKKLELGRSFGGLGSYFYSKAHVERGGIEVQLPLSQPAMREIADIVLADTKRQMQLVVSKDWKLPDEQVSQ